MSGQSEKKILCHVQLLGGFRDNIEELILALRKAKEQIDSLKNVEFIVTNEHIEFKSVDSLIEALKELKSQEDKKGE